MPDKTRVNTMRLEQIRDLLAKLNQHLDSARPAAQMWVFTAAATLLTSVFFFLTRPAVEAHENQRLRLSLKELVPEMALTSATLNEAVEIPPIESGALPVQLYRLREEGTLKGLFLKVTTPNGYSGNIEFAMAVQPDGKIIGVRVLRHRETPGLGDWIETARSNWILAFDGKSLNNPPEMLWHVRKDGGIFDQFTGATITPRALVKGVHETLKSLEKHGEIQEGHE